MAGANTAFMGQSLGKPRRVVQVAGFAGAAQPAAQIDHRRAEVRFQVSTKLSTKLATKILRRQQLYCT